MVVEILTPMRGKSIKQQRYHFSTAESLTDKRIIESSMPEGEFGQFAAPSQAAFRAYIEAQICPFCNRGPWQQLSTHTHKKHGVSADELRKLAGMKCSEATCSKELSAERRKLTHNLINVEKTRTPEAIEKARLTREKRWQGEGLSRHEHERIQQQARKASSMSADERRCWHNEMVRKRMLKMGPIYAEIDRLYFEERMLIKDIAVVVGLGKAAISRYLHKHKNLKDGRAKEENRSMQRKSEIRLCSVGGCGQRHLAKGFCSKHYQLNVRRERSNNERDSNRH